MPPRHPQIARALGLARRTLQDVAVVAGPLRVLVACSGGADSVAMLGLLALVAEADGLEVSVGHVDHGLRPESARDAEHVQSLSARLGLGAQIRRLHLPAGPALADRARAARHAALRAIARSDRADVVALGHTTTDQAETVLLHLGRGAGLDGLSGMPRVEHLASDDVWVIRPLLDLTRAEARELAGHLDLPFVDDPTNEDPSHPRVLVRTELLPRLESIRGSSAAAIAAAADRIAEADEALELWARRELRERSTDAGLRVAGIEALPRAIRTRLIRQVALAAGVQRDRIGRRLVDQIDRALCDGTTLPRSWDVAAQRRLRLADERLEILATASTTSPNPPVSRGARRTEGREDDGDAH